MKIWPEDVDIEHCQHVKFGIDPTSDVLHLGHLVPLRVIRRLQEQGKRVTIVLGTWTAQLGDPSGKNKMRPMLDANVVHSNASNIHIQLSQILHPGFEIFYNHNLPFTAYGLLEFISKFNVNELLARNSFRERQAKDIPIGMHELLVPVLQGLDSFYLNCDLEIGGEDQLFNFSITRKLQEKYGQKPQACILTPLINGTDGRKMSKSFANHISFHDSAENIFGKCMSVDDETMMEWIPILTDITNTDVHPLELKKQMAFDITKQFCGVTMAEQAQEEFELHVQNNIIPDESKRDFIVIEDDESIIDLICKSIKCSKSEARRLLNSNAIKQIVDNELHVINDNLVVRAGNSFKIGKRKFVTAL